MEAARRHDACGPGGGQAQAALRGRGRRVLPRPSSLAPPAGCAVVAVEIDEVAVPALLIAAGLIEELAADDR